MEENNNNTQEATDVSQVAAPEGDVPQAEVEKVITENGNQSTEEYKDLTGGQTPTSEQEAQAKTELDNTVVAENPPQIAAPIGAAPVAQPAVNLGGESGSVPLDNQPAAEPAEAPAGLTQINIVPFEKPVDMRFLQFECDACKFKTYINTEDDKLVELPTKLKCMNCGKKKSIKRRIFDITLNGGVDYVESDEDPVAQPEASTQ